MSQELNCKLLLLNVNVMHLSYKLNKKTNKQEEIKYTYEWCSYIIIFYSTSTCTKNFALCIASGLLLLFWNIILGISFFSKLNICSLLPKSCYLVCILIPLRVIIAIILLCSYSWSTIPPLLVYIVLWGFYWINPRI